MLARRAGMAGAQALSVIDLITSDGGILAFAAVGIVATAVSILKDARDQRARRSSEELPVEVVEVRAA
jgi:hypothetical protein